jgi:hypothetical protein
MTHDNTHERQVAKPSVPVMKMIDGKACWKAFGRDAYVHEPELEAIYMAAQHQTIPNLNQIVTGDARQLAALIPDESVDFIFTDPVYENLDDYRWLAETAARVLRPGGACLAWCANVGQYQVQPIMAEYLKFVIPLSYTKIAKAYKAWGYKTFLWTTPCLWFQKGAHDHEWLIDTVVDHCNAIVSTSTPPTETYKWHKNPEAYIRWLQAFTKPGDVVYDPFTGSGSLPVECKRLGRNFIASELKPEIADMARARLAQVQVIDPRFEAEQVAMFESEAA